ncbi:hypothetical protein T484DRAFT_1810170 [Baffinella frigidus]|nr:hypothetical protein T484DRAFT_1810170 [Cryptophyta sp. CCMP2293]
MPRQALETYGTRCFPRPECSRRDVPPIGADPYEWMRDGESKEVKRFLEGENAYAERILKQVAPLEETLFREMSARVAIEMALFREISARVVIEEEGDAEMIEGWAYYMRTASAFPIFCRRRKPEGKPQGEEQILLDQGEEQILLDQDAMSRTLPYLSVTLCKISPCHSMLAYTMDTTNTERYTGVVKDVESGKELCVIEDVVSLEFATDGRTILYTKPDENRRPSMVFRRSIIRQGAADDELVLADSDPAFFLDLGLTKDKEFVTINANSKVSSEVSSEAMLP